MSRGRIAGVGDIVLVRDASTYQPGDIITRDGVAYTVERDLGDAVVLLVPARRFQTKRGKDHLLIAANTVTVAKGDLVLETLEDQHDNDQ